MDASILFGSWLLESFAFEDLRTGERTHPLGEQPSGVISFQPDGRFFALMTAGTVEPPISELEQAAAFRRMIAYSGPYRLEDPDRLITTVDISWFPSWLGTEQIRFFNLKGDELWVRSAPLTMPTPTGEETRVSAQVVWRREARDSQ